MNKTTAVTKAASIKTTLTDLEDAVDALSDSPEKSAVQEQVQRLHAKLNGLAHRAADHFGDTVETFSGGTDKPEEP